jgi:DNA-binding transcriptional LysR family regulator
MDMELRHIRYFLAVAGEMNFTRAAKKVGIGQPPLSQQIQSLEKELGAPLFRRVPRGVELTDSGKVFLPEAQAILAQAERAKKIAQRGARGELGNLRLGFTSSAAFTGIVRDAIRVFRENYPNVELTLEEEDTTTLLDRLSEQTLDAAFIRPGRNDPDGVQVHRLVEEATMIALPSDHPLVKASALPLSALAKDRFLLFPRSAGPGFFDEIISACRGAGFEPRMGYEAPQITSVGNMIAAGLGVSIVPISIANQVCVAGVKYLKIVGDAPIAPIALAIRPDEQSVTVKNFVTLAITKRVKRYHPKPRL